MKIIEVMDLCFSYEKGKDVLQKASFSIEKGDSLAVIGANGSGKTTLMLALNGLIDGFEGEIRIDGIRLTPKTKHEIRKKSGLVFQDPDDQLFCGDVYDDVAFGPQNMGLKQSEIENRVNYALAAVDMKNYIHREPHHLSFGEKKRIAIATVLSMKPDTLMLDEPSLGLDPKARYELISFLRQLNVTKIISGHDLELLRALCNKFIILKDGRITAAGTISELFGDMQVLQENELFFEIK